VYRGTAPQPLCCAARANPGRWYQTERISRYVTSPKVAYEAASSLREAAISDLITRRSRVRIPPPLLRKPSSRQGGFCSFWGQIAVRKAGSVARERTTSRSDLRCVIPKVAAWGLPVVPPEVPKPALRHADASVIRRVGGRVGRAWCPRERSVAGAPRKVKLAAYWGRASIDGSVAAESLRPA
jgi:hypothetical protein